MNTDSMLQALMEMLSGGSHEDESTQTRDVTVHMRLSTGEVITRTKANSTIAQSNALLDEMRAEYVEEGHEPDDYTVLGQVGNDHVEPKTYTVWIGLPRSNEDGQVIRDVHITLTRNNGETVERQYEGLTSAEFKQRTVELVKEYNVLDSTHYFAIHNHRARGPFDTFSLDISEDGDVLILEDEDESQPEDEPDDDGRDDPMDNPLAALLGGPLPLMRSRSNEPAPVPQWVTDMLANGETPVSMETGEPYHGMDAEQGYKCPTCPHFTSCWPEEKPEGQMSDKEQANMEDVAWAALNAPDDDTPFPEEDMPDDLGPEDELTGDDLPDDDTAYGDGDYEY